MASDERLAPGRFPRASKYHPEWVLAGVGSAANPLWLTEWLTEALDLRPGMRVLDLGCGRALSSIFLHREFGAQVWAADLWFSASENSQRIRDAGVDFVLHCNGRTEEMRAIADVTAALAGEAGERAAHALSLIRKPEPLDRIAAREELVALANSVGWQAAA